MTAISSIALNKLIAWDGNVRKTAGTKEGLAELAASIKAHGLINPLSVRPAKNGAYEVGAGGRRHAALQLLAKNGDIPADFGIPCHVHDGITDQAFLEISLAENRAREDMHPADEFEAFRKLADDGLPAIEIGARFGVTERYVLQRLKLSRVSPVILKAYRAGETSLDCVMAFAVTDDKKRQERLWKSVPDHMRDDADSIRGSLTEGEIDASDKRVRLVTLSAYEQAGGTTRRDLFAEGDHGVFITKPELLQELALARIDAEIEAVRKEGWKWVEALGENPWETKHKCQRINGTEGKLPAQRQKELDKLTAEYKKLDKKRQDDDLSLSDEERFDELYDLIHDIEAETPEIFTPNQMANAGAFIELEDDGTFDIQRGYVKPEDAKAAKKANPKTKGKADDKPAEEAGLPKALVADLIAERTAAVAAVLSTEPLRGFQLIVCSLAMPVFYDDAYYTDRPVSAHINFTDYPPGFEDKSGSRGIAELQKRLKAVKAKLPKKPEGLLAWCLDADAKQLMEVIAVVAAHAVVNKGDGRELIEPLFDIDMAEWFTPTVDNYFGRIGKAQIIADLKDIGKGGLNDPAKTPKSEAAAFAARYAKEANWLPKLLRTAPAKAEKKPKKKAA